jgi:uncharacterized protein (TIGR00255 family)
MVKSMTGFAAQSGEIATENGSFVFQWDLRAVNGRGLELRFRLPDWLDGLEAGLRKALSARLKRGNVTLSLRLSRAEAEAGPRLNPVALETAVALMRSTETRAAEAGLHLAPITAADLLSIKGVMDVAPDLADPAPLVATLLTEAERLIDAFESVRRSEGAALAIVLAAQIDQIASLAAQARTAAEARAPEQAAALRAALSRIVSAVPQADPARLEQELALIAVKTDVTEELDRLDAHVSAARSLLASQDPVGRKLDFLMQEFNREANTLCSKAQNAALTRIGLDLKTVIDQMREQVQNLE